MEGRGVRGGWWVLFGIAWLMGLSAGSRANVGVTPMRLDVYAEPGGPAETVWLTVTNTSDEPRNIALTPEFFDIAPDGSLLFEPRLREERGSRYVPPHSGAAFLTVEGSPVFLQPGESRRVPVRVRLPADARGEYYAMITANPGPATPVSSPRGNREVRITFEISVMVIIVAGVVYPPRVPGDSPTLVRATPARYEVEVTDLRVLFPKPTEPRQTLKIAGTFVNRGNAHIFADFTAKVRSVDERRSVEEVIFGGGARLVLPGAERRLLGEVTAPLSPGRYEVELSIRWDDQSAPAVRKTAFEVLVPIAGAPLGTKRLGVLGVQPERLVLAVPPGRVVREEILVTNNVDDRLTVVVPPVQTGGAPVVVSVAPSRFVMPPGAERTVQVRLVVPPDAPSGIHELSLVLEPIASSGERFPPAESRAVPLVLRILPPPPKAVHGK